jgi:hypothetical protein
MAAQKVRTRTLVTSHRNFSRSGDGLHRLHARSTARQTSKLLQTDSKRIADVRACRPCGGGGDGWSRQVWSRTDIYDQCVHMPSKVVSTLHTVSSDWTWQSTTVDSTTAMERIGLGYWTGLDWIDLDCTDCPPVAGIIVNIKLSQPCVRVLVQASV